MAAILYTKSSRSGHSVEYDDRRMWNNMNVGRDATHFFATCFLVLVNNQVM